MNPSGWLEAIKLRPRYLFAIFLTGSFMLWMSDDIAVRFSVKTLYRPWIGFATLITGIIWGIHAILHLGEKISLIIKIAKHRKQVLKRLQFLSEEEKRMLLSCITENAQTIRLEVIDGVGHSLCSKGMMIRASGGGSILEWPHTIPDWLWEYLKKHSDELFKGINKDVKKYGY